MSTPPRRPRVRNDLVCREVDEDFVVYDPISDRTILLNLSAAVVFELCDGSRAMSEIVTATARTYSASEQHLRNDVETTIGDFQRQGLFAGSWGDDSAASKE